MSHNMSLADLGLEPGVPGFLFFSFLCIMHPPFCVNSLMKHGKHKFPFLCMVHWKQHSAIQVKSELRVRRKCSTSSNKDPTWWWKWIFRTHNGGSAWSQTVHKDQSHKTSRISLSFTNVVPQHICFPCNRNNCKFFLKKVNNRRQKFRSHHENHCLGFHPRARHHSREFKS